MRCVGGPFDGRDIEPAEGVTVLCPCLTGDCANEPFVYYRTLPTDTNWRDGYDHDWFIHGLRDAPPIPEHVWEWHERGWQSPEVAMIRGALTEAMDRF